MILFSSLDIGEKSEIVLSIIASKFLSFNFFFAFSIGFSVSRANPTRYCLVLFFPRYDNMSIVGTTSIFSSIFFFLILFLLIDLGLKSDTAAADITISDFL